MDSELSILGCFAGPCGYRSPRPSRDSSRTTSRPTSRDISLCSRGCVGLRSISSSSEKDNCTLVSSVRSTSLCALTSSSRLREITTFGTFDVPSSGLRLLKQNWFWFYLKENVSKREITTFGTFDVPSSGLRLLKRKLRSQLDI
ncbi:unnamed protein product [Haemonchus placei]|uniref:Uncharacterized protein n=1 Tax=Haemonchus placei TaxID=6290 RepID=A0A3P7XEF8_HAEPC|nr:unnamed protein product [Haemonchus placei]